MKKDGLFKHALVAFVLALAVYALLYSTIEHRRTRKGPWTVTFTQSGGAPALLVNQASLSLTNVQLRFPGAALPAGHTRSTYFFRQPKPTPFDLPFGQCIFMDLTFLPGTVVFHFYGHEIELLPRTLVIDHEEHPWASNTTLNLPPVATPKGEPKR